MPLYFDDINFSGGGYLTGLYCHPVDPNRVIARCDVAGFYSWQPETKFWKQLLDFTAENSHLWGAGGCAFHPTDSNTFWLSVGTFFKGGSATKGGLFKTTNGGVSFSEINFPNIGIGGNDGNGRLSPTRLAVCPSDTNIIIQCGYSNSQIGPSSGIYRTTNGGTSWTYIDFNNLCPGQTVPSTNADIGQTFIIFDPDTPTVCYCGIFGLGISKSTDSGATWTFIGGPIYPTDAVIYQGALYAGALYQPYDYNGAGDNDFNGVSRYISSWTSLFKNAAISWISLKSSTGEMSAGWVDDYDGLGKGRFYYSLNQWATTRITYQFTTNFVETTTYYGVKPYPPGNAVSRLNYAADGKAFLIDTLRAWKNDNYHTTGDLWIDYSAGLNNTAVYDFTLIPKADGTEILYSALYDILSLQHNRGFTQTPTSKIGVLSDNIDPNKNAFNISYCTNSPANIVVSTSDYFYPPNSWILHSTNYGANWKKTIVTYLSRVCMSSSNPNLVVVLRRANQPQFADGKDVDGSYIWKSFATANLPSFIYNASWYGGQPLTADPNNSNVFWCLQDNNTSSNFGYLYKFTYSAGNMTAAIVSSGKVNYNSWGFYPGLIKILPDGKIFVYYGKEGLFLSTNNGVSFSQITSVTHCAGLDYGKEKPGTSVPTLWMSGSVSNVYGIWESNDFGTTWTNQMVNTSYSPYNSPASLDIPKGVGSLTASKTNYQILVYGTGSHGGRYSSIESPFGNNGNIGGGSSSGVITQIVYNQSLSASSNTIQLRII